MNDNIFHKDIDTRYVFYDSSKKLDVETSLNEIVTFNGFDFGFICCTYRWVIQLNKYTLNDFVRLVELHHKLLEQKRIKNSYIGISHKSCDCT